jgi:hypothetical protein
MIKRRTREQYDFDACEFDDLRLPASWGRFTAPRRRRIQFIVAHHMVVKDTDPNDDEALAKCREIWRNRPASAHYGVDNDFIAQFVSDAAAAYATADSVGNHAGISIEHVDKTLDEKGHDNDYVISEKTWKTGAKLVAYLHKLHGLGRPVKNVTIRKHSSFFATSCPGPYFDKIWDQYVKEAQRVYDSIGKVSQPKPQPAPDVTPGSPVWNKPETWVKGEGGPDVVKLGRRLQVWSKALGLPSPYVREPDAMFSKTDVEALSRIQKKWWPDASTKPGGDADGYPGLETFKRLASAPK